MGRELLGQLAHRVVFGLDAHWLCLGIELEHRGRRLEIKVLGRLYHSLVSRTGVAALN